MTIAAGSLFVGADAGIAHAPNINGIATTKGVICMCTDAADLSIYCDDPRMHPRYSGIGRIASDSGDDEGDDDPYSGDGDHWDDDATRSSFVCAEPSRQAGGVGREF